ncbi:MAG: sigma factor [Solirubrobacteraceae bacterium]
MARSRSRSRLESLFASHAAVVLAYARRRTDSMTADDVLSEVFATAWRRLEQIPQSRCLGCRCAPATRWLTPAAASIVARP